MKKLKKRGAFELSMTTVVILVIAMVMLALGLVMVRRIMCGAIGLTSTINQKIHDKINQMFEAEGGEVQCIGAGTETVYLIPGKVNYIYCGINAPKDAEYIISIESITDDAKDWIYGSEGWKGTVSPGDTQPKKILRLKIPKDAPEIPVIIHIKVTKNEDGESKHVATLDLDFQVKRIGGLRGAIC